MSYFSEQYRFYVPPHISGTEEVRMSIMKATPTQEMEQRIRMRFAFAMSAFARMFRPDHITLEMRDVCRCWSEDLESNPPRADLYQVDRYFLEIWKNRYDLNRET